MMAPTGADLLLSPGTHPRVLPVVAATTGCKNRRPPMSLHSRSPRVPAAEEDTTDTYDVIIIGTGAGGGTLAHHLWTRGASWPD
jgi:NADPH-dependent 2,4-dienoyl-CoA reductase/sulfur reductase-like enzyme